MSVSVCVCVLCVCCVYVFLLSRKFASVCTRACTHNVLSGAKPSISEGLVSRDQPIMLIILPIMLCCSAKKFDLLCSILCSCRNCSIRVYSLVS